MANTKISALTAATTPLAGTEVLPIVQSSTTKQVSIANVTAGRVVSTAKILAGSTTTPSAATAKGALIGDSGSDVYFQLTNGSGGGSLIGSALGGGFQIYTFTGVIGSETYTLRTTMDNSGNLTMSTGNLVQGTAAKGFNFTANTPASGMTSQLLNWYEEGTWTPTLTFGGNAVGLAYSRQFGQYTRVGNMVTIYFQFDLTNKGSSTGNATISGLPFTAKNTANNITGFSPYTDRVNSAIQLVLVYNTTSFVLYDRNVLGLSNTQLTNTAFNNTSFISGSFSYVI